jgi:hypothetical protein
MPLLGRNSKKEPAVMSWACAPDLWDRLAIWRQKHKLTASADLAEAAYLRKRIKAK